MIYVLIHEDKVTERALFVALYRLDNRCVHNFTISPPPLHLAFAFHPPPPFYKNSISDSCTGWEKCDALPTARSVIASEPQWGPKPPPPPAALLTSGNLDVSQVVAPAAAD